jgi:hypothetical protein
MRKTNENKKGSGFVSERRYLAFVPGNFLQN